MPWAVAAAPGPFCPGMVLTAYDTTVVTRVAARPVRGVATSGSQLTCHSVYVYEAWRGESCPALYVRTIWSVSLCPFRDGQGPAAVLAGRQFVPSGPGPYAGP
jgi:hypothetical protein